MSKHHRMHGFFALLLLSTLISGGCASTHGSDDPLKYTKKLAAEGHATLYNNGAFAVPNTSIKLIPPMPETTDLVMEIMGMRAYQSFQTSLTRAAESVTIIADGTRKSFELAKDVREIGKDAADAIDQAVAGGGKVLIYKSTDLGKQIVGRSWDTAGELMRSGAGEAIVKESRAGGEKIVAGSAAAGERLVSGSGEAGDRIVEGSSRAGKSIITGGMAAGDTIVSGSRVLAKDVSSSSIDRSGRTFSYAGTSFIKGYAAVPASLKKRAAATGDNLQKMNPVDIVGKENEWRGEWSRKTVDLMSETISDYGKNATSSFRKAGVEMSENYKTQGVPLSVLKSMRWVLQGILWDATVEPIAKTSGALLGYVSINMVVFPTMVVAREGVSTAQLAVQVTMDTAKTGYDIVAPTAVAAVAGVFGVADLAVSQPAAAATAVAGPVVGYAEKGISAVAGVTVMSGGYVTGKAVEGTGYVAGKGVEGGGYVAGKTVKGGGYVAGKTVQYLAVPLASAGIVIGGGTIGTAVGVTGVVTGGTVVVAGETGSAATNVFGNVIAVTTLVAGTAVSTGGGAAYGVYQLSKAVVVPAGYELGGGIVLSYETLSQLSAQSILAVSDCAYMVLSLEGPRWVLYAVRGKLGKGEDLPTGAVLDLKKMQDQGEEIVNLPVSDEEMKKVVESVYGNLPETRANAVVSK